MNTVTFLGPIGATFSSDAYEILAELYKAPQIDGSTCVPASSNGEILNLILEHGGHGTIAMETLAEGRITEPLESFIDLLSVYADTSKCPLHIVGAIRLQLHFCLMARLGVSKPRISKIIAHPKAFGACKKQTIGLDRETVHVSSNGEAARLVATDDTYQHDAAIGPRSAANKYGLEILDSAFEDTVAATTFFLIAPKSHCVSTGSVNRVLIVFKVPHVSGALVTALTPFANARLNLIQIHSAHSGNKTYDFAIEIEVLENELKALDQALVSFSRYVEKHLVFGPFEVLWR